MKASTKVRVAISDEQKQSARYFGMDLARIRQQYCTQNQLAERAEGIPMVTSNEISGCEKGRLFPTPHTFFRIVEVLKELGATQKELSVLEDSFHQCGEDFAGDAERKLRDTSIPPEQNHVDDELLESDFDFDFSEDLPSSDVYFQVTEEMLQNQINAAVERRMISLKKDISTVERRVKILEEVGSKISNILSSFI